MPTVFINNLAVTLPFRDAEGDPLTLEDALLFFEIQKRRIRVRLSYLLARGAIAAHELQAKADELAAAPLVPYITLDDNDDTDPVLQEALTLAGELILARLAADNIPPPKNLDAHARELVSAMPELFERARVRVEARYSAAVAVLEEL